MKQCCPCSNSKSKSKPVFNQEAMPDLPIFDAVLAEMNKLAGKYAFVKLSEYGRSVMGKPLLYICAGSGTRRVFYSASHHANEWITTLILLKYMNELFEKAQSNSQIGSFNAKELLSRTRLCFAPLVNPDGVDLVLGKLSSGIYYDSAKTIADNYPFIPFTSGWKANIEGTDLNLQYPANWQKAKQIKFEQGFVSPAPRDYVGSEPLAAPESRALAEFTRISNPETIIALHTQGNVIYWKFADFEPDGAYELGLKLAAASGYELSQTPPISDNAGYKDWFIQDFNRPGYTVEMGLGENPLPLTQFNSIYSAMEPLLSTAAYG
ncbi:MAG: M14 family metallocarboxypeptidase [Oscillospiraceae bacterium]|nr:M14 family metallocarboxypeptidase [Oscillospiraceae bacterium]